MGNTLIVGASRGLGAALAQGIAASGGTIYVVSRNEPSYTRTAQHTDRLFSWIKADLRNPRTAVDTIAESVNSSVLDLVIYNAGIWERNEYLRSDDNELLDVINVNMAAPILLFRRILPNILASEAPLVVLIGSTSGLDNTGSKTVAYTSTKFGLRGLAHSLREVGRTGGLRVTCISPGSIAPTGETDNSSNLAATKETTDRIPTSDIVTLITTLRTMSPVSCVKEIVMPAIPDTDA